MAHHQWNIPGTLAEEVRQNFQRLQGQRIRGIRWDRYDAEGQFLWGCSKTHQLARFCWENMWKYGMDLADLCFD